MASTHSIQNVRGPNTLVVIAVTVVTVTTSYDISDVCLETD